jgi:hypothetical protein
MKMFPTSLGPALAATLLLGPAFAGEAVTDGQQAQAAATGLSSYELIDSDRDGILSAVELGTHLRSQGDRTPISTTDLGARLIARLDLDADGRLLVSERSGAAAKLATQPPVNTLEWRTLPARPTDRVANDETED